MPSVFSIFTGTRSQEDIKKDVLKFFTQRKTFDINFRLELCPFQGFPREKLHSQVLAKSVQW